MVFRKATYFYNTDTCSYERVSFSWGNFFKNLGILIGFGGATALLTYVMFTFVLVDFKEDFLLEKNTNLISLIDEMNQQLDTQEHKLQELRSRDNGIYLPIIGEKGISRSAWEGGRGGSAGFRARNLSPAEQMQERIRTLHHQVNLLGRTFAAIRGRAGLKEEELKNIPSLCPVNANMISGFGNRIHPVTKRVKFHEGLDFACTTGTPIYASGNAVVETAGYNEHGYGININLDHQNGYQTKFAHLSKILVEEGQRVTRGELIGYSGNTGMSTGPHLHYEVSYQGVKIDPLDYFYEDLSPEKYHNLSSGETADPADAKAELKEQLSKVVPMD